MKHLRLSVASPGKQTVVKVGNAHFGEKFVVIAGPCSVESEEQTLSVAFAVQSRGADMLRGGVFKPRTSPYAFQGLGMTGLKILAKAREQTGLPFVTEVLDTRDVSWVAEYADMLQIGARNMQNFSLLKEVGRSNRAVMLKRGMHSTIEEWLSAAEYILAGGNQNVILCERGIRTFETYTRNTLDLSAIAAVRGLSHLPVISDPSHGCGRIELMESMALASVTAGAQGIMMEVHCNPEQALSDKDQALLPDAFGQIVPKIRSLVGFMDTLRDNAKPSPVGEEANDDLRVAC